MTGAQGAPMATQAPPTPLSKRCLSAKGQYYTPVCHQKHLGNQLHVDIPTTVRPFFVSLSPELCLSLLIALATLQFTMPKTSISLLAVLFIEIQVGGEVGYSAACGQWKAFRWGYKVDDDVLDEL
jgi:hypothetical protein